MDIRHLREWNWQGGDQAGPFDDIAAQRDLPRALPLFQAVQVAAPGDPVRFVLITRGKQVVSFRMRDFPGDIACMIKQAVARRGLAARVGPSITVAGLDQIDGQPR